MDLLKKSYYYLSGKLRTQSLKRAVYDQSLDMLTARLSELVPDVTHQYKCFNVDSEYIEVKVRSQHAFQISLVGKAIELMDLKKNNRVNVTDMGDSAGTHILYLKKLYPELNIESLSVTDDDACVLKIEKKGLRGIRRDVEVDMLDDASADIVMAFEVMEHFKNPIGFLKKLFEQVQCKAFVFTVPYLSQSRIGLYHIRKNELKDVNSENTHVFELSPMDWKLLFKQCGWKILHDDIYYQYPKKHFLSLTKKFWKDIDFEGFYGGILVKDDRWLKRYKGW